ncbi:MAG TPA: hypothetical protein VLQ93_23380, partial [Myxococcaceae bacterium]|nr:hypothetical protein [Myxococcaceae bacterium]
LATAVATMLWLTTSACGPTQPEEPFSGTGGEAIHTTVDADGALHFESAQAFSAALKHLAEMSLQERDAWEARHGFMSMRRAYSQLTQRLESVRTEEEHARLLQEYRDVIKMTDDGIAPLVELDTYASIANRRGVFYVDGAVHKVTRQWVFSAADGRLDALEQLLATPAVEARTRDSDTLDLPQGVRGMRHTVDSRVVAQGVCGSEKSTTYTNGDRRLLFYIRTYAYTVYDCCSYYQGYAVQWEMRGKKKNLFGSWVSYSTAYEYRNVSTGLDVPRVTGSNGSSNTYTFIPVTLWAGYGASDADAEAWYLTVYPGDLVRNVTLSAPSFDKVHGEASSRGIGANWAIIDCGYCSDSTCNSWETASSCRADCGYCGDGVCYGSETTSNCPGDCGYCGDGICRGGETASSCRNDCGYCGDGYCASTEAGWCTDCGGGGCLLPEPC